MKTWRRIADMVAREPERVDHDLWWLADFVPDLVRLSTRDRLELDRAALRCGVAVRWLRKNTLGLRVWLCGVATLDGRPWMLFQCAGKGGDCDRASWVLDAAAYAEAVHRLSGRARPRVPQLSLLHWRDPRLGAFYGQDIDGPGSTYNQDLMPNDADPPHLMQLASRRYYALSRRLSAAP